MANSGKDGDISSSSGDEVVDKGLDYANYFCTYSFLYHQKQMLNDDVRMKAYYNAVFENKHHFQGKTVLDVGAGSGILAIWAGQAGARKVYAVEATSMAYHARALVEANNLQNVIEVVCGSIEDIILPERVDVIISEWMGHFLLREAMIDSVICARDRWLKPTGVMYPSHARMWFAPIRSERRDEKRNYYDGAMANWDRFTDEIKTKYGVDMSVLTEPYDEENRQYYLQTSSLCDLRPNQVIGTAVVIKEIDCLTVTVADISKFTTVFSSVISAEEDPRLCGFTGWFDVQFRGNEANPVANEIVLTTAPGEEENCSHWGQQMFLLDPAVDVSKDDHLCLTLTMERSKANHRLLEFQLSCYIVDKQGCADNKEAFIKKFYID